MTINKIFIIGPAWVGDMVMAQTLFKVLKTQHPHASIDVMAPDWTRALLERMPEIQQALPLPIGHGQLMLSKRYQLGQQLRANQYDQAIVLPNSFKSALIPFFANIPQRTGWLGELRFGLLNDVRFLNKKKLSLMIQRFAALGYPKNANLPEPLPWPELIISHAALDLAITKHQLNPSSKPVLALCPGAEYGPAKRWPAEYFATLAKTKIAEGWQVWLFGSVKDQESAAIIQQATAKQCVDLTGRTSLAEAIDLLSLATVVVSNDSGLMHIASALKKPVVAIFGSSSPTYTPPLNHQVKILSVNLACSPCFKRECPLTHLNCLKTLMPEQVISAVDALSA